MTAVFIATQFVIPKLNNKITQKDGGQYLNVYEEKNEKIKLWLINS